jgi:hypothetical protein
MSTQQRWSGVDVDSRREYVLRITVSSTENHEANMAAESAASDMDKATSETGSGEEPVIIDLGKKDRKQVRKLRKGRPCRLLDRVQETIEHLRTSPEFAEGVKPVIIVVRERARRKGRQAAKMWGLG